MSTPYWQTAVFCSVIQGLRFLLFCGCTIFNMQFAGRRKTWKLVLGRFYGPVLEVLYITITLFHWSEIIHMMNPNFKEGWEMQPLQGPEEKKILGQTQDVVTALLIFGGVCPTHGCPLFLALQLTEGQVLKLASPFSGFSTFLPCAVRQGKGHRSLSASPKPVSA